MIEGKNNELGCVCARSVGRNEEININLKGETDPYPPIPLYSQPLPSSTVIFRLIAGNTVLLWWFP